MTVPPLTLVYMYDTKHKHKDVYTCDKLKVTYIRKRRSIKIWRDSVAGLPFGVRFDSNMADYNVPWQLVTVFQFLFLVLALMLGLCRFTRTAIQRQAQENRNHSILLCLCLRSCDDLSFISLFSSAVQIYDFHIFIIISSPKRVHVELTEWPAPSWLDGSIGRALHRYLRGHGFESRSSLNFFQA